MKISQNKKVGPADKRFTKILKIDCHSGGCISECKTVNRCTRMLQKLPNFILQQGFNNQKPEDAEILDEFLENVQRGPIYKHPNFINKNKKIEITPHPIKPIDTPPMLGELDLKIQPNGLCDYTKVIRTPGLSRGYHKKSVNIMSKADFTGLYRKGHSIKIRIRRRKGTTRFESVQEHLKYLKNPGLVKLFETYVHQTKPALTYYLVRKRSYMKKRKVFINSFKLKIAKDFNRQNKLFHQIKTIYFRGRNRKTAGNIIRSTKKFISREFFKIGQNKLLKKKKQIYNNYGHDSMNELLLKFL